jgi:hypothetical protein
MYLHLKPQGLTARSCQPHVALPKEKETEKKDPRPYQGYHEPVEKQWAISAPHTCRRVTSHIAVTSAKELFSHSLSQKLAYYQHLFELFTRS